MTLDLDFFLINWFLHYQFMSYNKRFPLKVAEPASNNHGIITQLIYLILYFNINFMRAYSPIRNLQTKESRDGRMPTIAEEDHDKRNAQLEEENSILKRELARVAAIEEDIHIVLQENARLKNQMEKMARGTGSDKQSLLKLEIIRLNDYIEDLSSEKTNIINSYEAKLLYLKNENNQIKKKWTEKEYIKQINEEAEKTKLLLKDKTLEVQLKFQEINDLKQNHNKEIENKIKEINQLKNNLTHLQNEKEKEIQNLLNKSELEKSRTTGIIGHSKQSSNFMEKEIRKLSAELKEKNTQLQNLSKSYLSQKKKTDELTKNHADEITLLKKEYEERIRQKITQFQKRESILKEELLFSKKKETELYLIIDKHELTIQNHIKNEQHLEQNIQELSNQSKELKATIEKEREDHLRELNKVMTEKLKRRSSRMLSSQRSLNESMKESVMVQSPRERQKQTPQQQEKIFNILPSVKQEVYLRESNKLQSKESIQIMNNESNDIQSILNHFKGVNQELKTSHNADIHLLKVEIQRLTTLFNEKCDEYEDLLKRFAPLIKIRAGEISLEQDRKERMERHWKADITLLQVLLQKNNIRIH